MFGNMALPFSTGMDRFQNSAPPSISTSEWPSVQRDAADIAGEMLGPDYTIPDWMGFQDDDAGSWT